MLLVNQAEVIWKTLKVKHKCSSFFFFKFQINPYFQVPQVSLLLQHGLTNFGTEERSLGELSRCKNFHCL